MNLEELRKRRFEINNKINNTLTNMEMIVDESNRVTNVAHNSKIILDNLDEEFEKQTGLKKIDVAFLIVAVGLQITRQYLITKFQERLSDKEAAKKTKGHTEEHSNRQHRYYNPSLEEIITNPVPFDANIGANGSLSGGGKMGHRVMAIGHDPLLGLIFGTANIATSTLTTANMHSYHIYTVDKRDTFTHSAKTSLVLKTTKDKLFNNGIEGKTIIGTSILKEIIHLKSDIHTKHSLPLPIISAFDPKLACELAEYGLDMSNVVTVAKQADYAAMINLFIAMIHRLFYDESIEVNKKMYEVRTRKILSYSNFIASSSNVAIVAVTKDLKLLDLGGLAVTLHRLINDPKFIQGVKEEFICNSFNEMIHGSEYNFL